MSHPGTGSSHPATPAGAGMTPESRILFPAIADYGFLSDCETNALVAPSGAVEWMCVPRPDSPSVFSALLDRGAGQFRVGPYGVRVPVARRYLPGTLVLETTWQTSTGWLVVRDALVLGPWHHTTARSRTHRRTPTDDDAEHVLLRTVKCVSGAVDLEVVCEPRPGYGRDAARWEYGGDAYGIAVARPQTAPAAEPPGLSEATGDAPRAGSVAAPPDPRLPDLRLTSSLRIGLGEGRANARSRMTEGDEHFVALSWGEQPAPASWPDAVDAMWRTEQFWRGWITQGVFPDHPWRTHLQRSALTLKGLTYAPTGALLAAATTSLPETPQGPRNWDYRYSWVRDSTFALWGLYTLGLDREANDFFAFIQDVCHDDLQVMYGVGGEQRLDESELAHLSGYEGAQPVRIGNAAYAQDQHDVWGAVLDSVWVHAKSRDQLPESVWPLLRHQVEEAAHHWQEPDRGIWEVRGDPQHFVSSKLMCWVALDRGARLARLYDEPEFAEQWRKTADEVRADIEVNGVDRRGVFVQRYGSDALDASLLLVPLLRFLPPDDHRVIATVRAVADELTEDGLVLRYRVEETDDGLHTHEGAFAICSFWLVSALVEIGDVDRARSLCERLLGYASPLSLYAEQIDTATGRHLGNFPQAFTHLALINAVMHVIRAQGARGERFRFEAAHHAP